MKDNFYQVIGKLSDMNITNSELGKSFKEVFEEMRQYLKDHEIGMQNDYIYTEVNEEGHILIFIESSLAAVVTGWETGYLTEISKKLKSDCQEDFLNRIVMTALCYLYLVYQIDTKQIRVQESKRSFYTLCKIKKYKVEVRHWNNKGAFSMISKDNKLKVLQNGLNKTIFDFPSVLYPFPNNQPYQWFSEENTKDIEDNGELATILKDYTDELGKCYFNADDIVEILKQAGYTKKHKVDYYSGWMLMPSQMYATHHAWVVIDNHSIIDVAFKKDDLIKQQLELKKQGIYKEFNREILAKWIHEEKKKKKTFQERYNYGKTENFYIGTPCTKKEAIDSFQALLEKHPNHPSYNNVNRKSGQNKLQQIYYNNYN